MLQSAQLTLAWLLAAVAVGICLVALAGWRRPPLSRVWLDRLVLAGIAVSSIAAVLGALAFVIGDRPDDPLHFLYAVVSVAALPVARAWGESGPRPGVMLLGGLVLLGVTLRLFQTG